MGTQNLEDFKKTYFPAIRKKIRDIKKEKSFQCKCCDHSPKEHKSIVHFTKIETIKNLKISKSLNPSSPKKVEPEYLNDNDGYGSDETIYDTDEEEREKEREKKEKLLLMLDKYRFIPKN